MPSAAGVWRFGRKCRGAFGKAFGASLTPTMGFAFVCMGMFAAGSSLWSGIAVAGLLCSGGAFAVSAVGAVASAAAERAAARVAGPASLVRMAQMELSGEFSREAIPGPGWRGARALLSKAAERGDPSAFRVLGEAGIARAMEDARRRGGEVRAEALRRGYDASPDGHLLRSAVEAGDPLACLRVGAWSQDGGTGPGGEGMWPQDHAVAAELLSAAARAGEPEGMRRLGDARELGEGVPMDSAGAERMWLRAAAAGDLPARERVGRLHLLGRACLPPPEGTLAEACRLAAALGQDATLGEGRRRALGLGLGRLAGSERLRSGTPVSAPARPPRRDPAWDAAADPAMPAMGAGLGMQAGRAAAAERG